MSENVLACASVTNRPQRGVERLEIWLRGLDLNQRPLGYEPNELPDCSTPQVDDNNAAVGRQTLSLGPRYSHELDDASSHAGIYYIRQHPLLCPSLHAARL